MSLINKFWQTLEDKQESLGPPPDGLDAIWRVVKPAPEDRSRPARELSRLARLCMRKRPPALLSQPSVELHPFVMILSAPEHVLPTFEELYEGYLDKNGYLAECLMLLKPHCDVPYALFVGPQHFFLYDLFTEDILRWSGEVQELESLLIAPLEQRENVRAQWDKLARRSRAQRAEEFSHWFDLWRVAIGSRQGDSTAPELVQTILQKAILLFLYDLYFGLEDADLRLRPHFLKLRQQRGRDPEAEYPFDGVAWLHQASEELYRRYHIDFLRWTDQESAFFSLMDSAGRTNLQQFIFELFLQSLSKFDVEVQAEVFSDPDARLKMWRFSVTETLDIHKRLPADDVNIYAPLEVDLDDSGLAWTLHVVGEILDYWREKCDRLEQELLTKNRVAVQFDMFQQHDLENVEIPTREGLFRTNLPRSLKVMYSDPLERITLEYLITLKIFDYCRACQIPLQPLDGLQTIFVEKAQH
jgi:hypothetical protein